VRLGVSRSRERKRDWWDGSETYAGEGYKCLESGVEEAEGSDDVPDQRGVLGFGWVARREGRGSVLLWGQSKAKLTLGAEV